MRITNQQALLSKYDFLNWLAMSKFEDQLPEASHDAFWGFVAEGCLVAMTSPSLDVADTLARMMASAITMRETSWLQNYGIALDVPQAIENLSFDGWMLFSDKTYETLHSFKYSRATLRSLRVYMPPMQRHHYSAQQQ